MRINDHIDSLSPEEIATYDFHHQGWQKHASSPIRLTSDQEKKIVEKIERHLNGESTVPEKSNKDWMIKRLYVSEEKLEKHFNTYNKNINKIITLTWILHEGM